MQEIGIRDSGGGWNVMLSVFHGIMPLYDAMF